VVVFTNMMSLLASNTSIRPAKNTICKSINEVVSVLAQQKVDENETNV